jgi:hypothetical protein
LLNYLLDQDAKLKAKERGKKTAEICTLIGTRCLLDSGEKLEGVSKGNSVQHRCGCTIVNEAVRFGTAYLFLFECYQALNLH